MSVNGSHGHRSGVCWGGRGGGVSGGGGGGH